MKIEEFGMLEYMTAMSNAPYDADKCNDCGGVGLKPIGCCSGFECGCQGSVTDYVKCSCGSPEPTDEQMVRWLGAGNELATN